MNRTNDYATLRMGLGTLPQKGRKDFPQQSKVWCWKGGRMATYVEAAGDLVVAPTDDLATVKLQPLLRLAGHHYKTH